MASEVEKGEDWSSNDGGAIPEDDMSTMSNTELERLLMEKFASFDYSEFEGERTGESSPSPDEEFEGEEGNLEEKGGESSGEEELAEFEGEGNEEELNDVTEEEMESDAEIRKEDYVRPENSLTEIEGEDYTSLNTFPEIKGEEAEGETGSIPLSESRSIWEDLDAVRRTHSDASHNLRSPDDSRTFLMLRQKSYVTVFESLALHTILEQLELELELLGHAFPGYFVQSDESDFLSYDERFSQGTKERELFHLPTLREFKDPFIVDQSQLGTAEERLARKLQKDRAFLQEIVSTAKDEILATRSFEKLKDHVHREDNRRHEEATLLERMDKAQLAVKKFKHRMTQYEAQMTRHEQNRKEMIRELRDQVHVEKMKGKAEARFGRAWYEAQNQFHFENLRSGAEIAKLRVKDVEIQMTRDRLVHKNLEAWTEMRCEEIRMHIRNWQEKTELDIADIEDRMMKKQEEIKAQEEFIRGLQRNIDERMEELGPYEEEKERLRLERIANLRLYHSARKIQRWWRAYMMEHNLYKKKPKKKGGKGKGKSKSRKSKK